MATIIMSNLPKYNPAKISGRVVSTQNRWRPICHAVCHCVCINHLPTSAVCGCDMTNKTSKAHLQLGHQSSLHSSIRTLPEAPSTNHSHGAVNITDSRYQVYSLLEWNLSIPLHTYERSTAYIISISTQPSAGIFIPTLEKQLNSSLHFEIELSCTSHGWMLWLPSTNRSCTQSCTIVNFSGSNLVVRVRVSMWHLCLLCCFARNFSNNQNRQAQTALCTIPNG